MARRARVCVNPAAGRSRCRAPVAVRRATRSTSDQSLLSRLLDRAAARHLHRRCCSGTRPGWRCACRAHSCGNGHSSHTTASRNPTPRRGGTHLAYCPSRRGTRRLQPCARRAKNLPCTQAPEGTYRENQLPGIKGEDPLALRADTDRETNTAFARPRPCAEPGKKRRSLAVRPHINLSPSSRRATPPAPSRHPSGSRGRDPDRRGRFRHDPEGLDLERSERDHALLGPVQRRCLAPRVRGGRGGLALHAPARAVAASRQQRGLG